MTLKSLDDLRELNRSRTIASFLMHIFAFASIVVACAYTCLALAVAPFSLGALIGAIFYVGLLLVLWD